MSSSSDLVLNLANLTGRGMVDINADDTDPKARPGSLYFGVDAYGPKIMKYCKFVDAASMGNLSSRPANAAISNITSGTTTSAVTTGLTANDLDGALLYVLDNDDSAGDAPEGEVSVIADNTTTTIRCETDYPYSVALAANDDLVTISTYQAEDAADGDNAVDVQGVVLGNAGITDNHYGWILREGFVVASLKASTGITVGNPVVADAAKIGSFGSDGQELWIGRALGTVTSDIVADVVPVQLKLFTCAGTGATP